MKKLYTTLLTTVITTAVMSGCATQVTKVDTKPHSITQTHEIVDALALQDEITKLGGPKIKEYALTKSNLGSKYSITIDSNDKVIPKIFSANGYKVVDTDNLTDFERLISAKYHIDIEHISSDTPTQDVNVIELLKSEIEKGITLAEFSTKYQVDIKHVKRYCNELVFGFVPNEKVKTIINEKENIDITAMVDKEMAGDAYSKKIRLIKSEIINSNKSIKSFKNDVFVITARKALQLEINKNRTLSEFAKYYGYSLDETKEFYKDVTAFVEVTYIMREKRYVHEHLSTEASKTIEEKLLEGERLSEIDLDERKRYNYSDRKVTNREKDIPAKLVSKEGSYIVTLQDLHSGIVISKYNTKKVNTLGLFIPENVPVSKEMLKQSKNVDTFVSSQINKLISEMNEYENTLVNNESTQEKSIYTHDVKEEDKVNTINEIAANNVKRKYENPAKSILLDYRNNYVSKVQQNTIAELKNSYKVASHKAIDLFLSNGKLNTIIAKADEKLQNRELAKILVNNEVAKLKGKNSINQKNIQELNIKLSKANENAKLLNTQINNLQVQSKRQQETIKWYENIYRKK